MKFFSAGVVGVAALALQASAAPLRVDVFVASPAAPISLEEALKYTEARPHVPIRVSGYGFVSGSGEARHPTIQLAEVPNEKPAHWVYRPAAGEQGAVIFEGPIAAPERGDAFRHWVMTHPEVEHGQGAVWRHRPQSESLVWGKKGHCQRKSWKASFNRFANNVREALGLSPIQPFHPHGHPHHNPPAMAGEAAYPPIATPVNTEYDHVMRKPDARWPMPFHHQGQDRHHRFHHHRGGDWHKKPFSRRIMHALYILGPVEGRIVAFVLGLGIGALIRVIFVMGILAYRSFTRRERGIRLPEDEEESEPIIVERIFEVKENEKAPAYTAVVSDGEQTLAPPS